MSAGTHTLASPRSGRPITRYTIRRMADRITVALVGLGYWGPNLARNFDDLPGADLAWLVDTDEEHRARYGARFPSARTTASFEEALADDAVDAVVIATPVTT